MDIALPRLVYRLTLLFLLMLPEIFLLLYYFLLQFFSWLLSVSLLVTFWITLYSHTDLLDLGSLADAKRRLSVSCSHLCTIQGKGVDVRNSSSTLCIRHYPTRFHWSTFLPGIIDRVLNYSHISFYESHLSVHIITSFRVLSKSFGPRCDRAKCWTPERVLLPTLQHQVISTTEERHKQQTIKRTVTTTTTGTKQNNHTD